MVIRGYDCISAPRGIVSEHLRGYGRVELNLLAIHLLLMLQAIEREHIEGELHSDKRSD